MNRSRRPSKTGNMNLSAAYWLLCLSFLVLTAGLEMARDDNDNPSAQHHEHETDHYPCFNKQDWKEFSSDKKCKTELDILHKYKKNEVTRKLNMMSLSANRGLEQGDLTEKDDIRLVVIGKTGQGKSATANTLLNGEMFKVDYGHKSVTKKSELRNATVNGRRIYVFDTPGLQDTDTSMETTWREITRIFTFYDKGVHAFLYIINLADPRFTKEDSEVLNLLEETFGGNFLHYCILVFTHGDDLQVDLDAYLTHQRDVHDTNRDDEKGFINLINTLSWRVVAIDNNHQCSPFETKRHRNVIFSMVDEMRGRNNPPVYTHKFFKEAQEEKERRRLKGLKEGWSDEDMELVEMILARNPDISRDELYKEVNSRKEKDRQYSREQVDRMKRQNEGLFSWLWGKVKSIFGW